MKKLTKKQREIIDNLNPRCEDCEHYREHKGRMMCHAIAPFLAYKETARLHPHGTTMNCGTEGKHFKPNAGAVPRRGSDVGTSPLLGLPGSGDK